jgi:ATP-dependent DNA ligase
MQAARARAWVWLQDHRAQPEQRNYKESFYHRLHAGQAKLVSPLAPQASLFEQACKMGLEEIVSKRRDRGYKAGPCKDWVKVKNPRSAAMIRAKEVEW